MWISRKRYNFLKENAEKNINYECAILTAKENQTRAVARAMEEYSSVLKERDELRLCVTELEYQLEEKDEIAYWEQGDFDDCGDICSNCGYDSMREPCYHKFCPSCGKRMKTT